MKCPNCGKEIANDSFFCEYCGTQIKPIKKVRKAPWVVMTIVFGVVLLGCVLIIALMVRRHRIVLNRLYGLETNYYYGDWTSTNKKDNTTSYKEYTFHMEYGDMILFDYEVSSEVNYDKLAITLTSPYGSIDTLCWVSGVVSNSVVKEVFSNGIYTLKVQYTKDQSYSKNRDQGEIRNLRVFKQEIDQLQDEAVQLF